MGKEWEMKFSVANQEILDEILQYVGAEAETISMSAVYYDTEDLALQKRKWTLRCRKEGENSVITMKTASDGFARGEWEYAAADLSQCASRLTALGAPKELEDLLQNPVYPVCGAVFTRRTAALSLPSCKAELALDYGKLFKGEKEIPLCELELELKEGDPQSVLDYAQGLQKKFSLTPESRSKFLRAVSL